MGESDSYDENGDNFQQCEARRFLIKIDCNSIWQSFGNILYLREICSRLTNRISSNYFRSVYKCDQHMFYEALNSNCKWQFLKKMDSFFFRIHLPEHTKSSFKKDIKEELSFCFHSHFNRSHVKMRHYFFFMVYFIICLGGKILNYSSSLSYINSFLNYFCTWSDRKVYF